MKGDWTADVKARMHRADILSRDLAKRCNFSYGYLSAVLHGRKGNIKTKNIVLGALSDIEREKGISPKTETEDRSSEMEAIQINLAKVPAAELRNMCSSFLESILNFYADPANRKDHDAWRTAQHQLTVQGGNKA